jgi:adenosylhomocysteine nucleosidase
MIEYGILGAMKVEIELIKKEMLIEEVKKICGFEFLKGKVYDKDIVLVQCGVGKVNASCCTQILIDNFKVQNIINTGIAGSMNEKVKIFDIVISDNVTHFDVNKVQMKNLFPNQEFFEADKSLIDISVKGVESIQNRNFDYHIGRIVSGEKFVSCNIEKNNIIKEFSPYCVEMEGSAIGHVAFLNKIPFVVIRGISDSADDNANDDFEKNETIIAENTSKLILKILKNNIIN